MPEWLSAPLFFVLAVLGGVIEWIFARSTVEILLFLILLCLWSISGKLASIRSSSRGANALASTVYADVAQQVIDDLKEIRVQTYHTMNAAIEAEKTLEELRKQLAPRSYEVDRHDY